MKLLIIRFSSIGDIIQCMGIIGPLKARYPHAEIHWITRADMAPLLTIDPRIDRLWTIDRNDGLGAFVSTVLTLKKERFTYIYDAHCNIRSAIVKSILCPFGIHGAGVRVVTRSKERIKRFLLFHLHINLFPKPFRALSSYMQPLMKFGVGEMATTVTCIDQESCYRFPDEAMNRIDTLLRPLLDKKWICIVPSAAWELKRWPVVHWKRLVEIMPSMHFVVIGGPHDTFCNEIAAIAPERVINLAGITTLTESLVVIYRAPYVISGDTGLLHVADLFNKPGQALIGPTAFGFPISRTMVVTEVDLRCRPCTKDGHVRCKNTTYQKCMLDITPEMVKEKVGRWEATS